LLNAEKITEIIPKTTADTPTVTATFVGLGTQICCARLGDDAGPVV
jgi:hypothetical protein